MTPPIIFADRYDPNKVFEHTYWVVVVAQKFFSRPPRQTLTSPKLSFFAPLRGWFRDAKFETELRWLFGRKKAPFLHKMIYRSACERYRHTTMFPSQLKVVEYDAISQKFKKLFLRPVEAFKLEQISWKIYFVWKTSKFCALLCTLRGYHTEKIAVSSRFGS